MGKKNKDIAEKDIRAEETAAEEKDIQPEAEEKETCTSSNFEGECEVGENPVPERYLPKGYALRNLRKICFYPIP